MKLTLYRKYYTNLRGYVDVVGPWYRFRGNAEKRLVRGYGYCENNPNFGKRIQGQEVTIWEWIKGNH